MTMTRDRGRGRGRGRGRRRSRSRNISGAGAGAGNFKKGGSGNPAFLDTIKEGNMQDKDRSHREER